MGTAFSSAGASQAFFSTVIHGFSGNAILDKQFGELTKARHADVYCPCFRLTLCCNHILIKRPRRRHLEIYKKATCYSRMPRRFRVPANEHIATILASRLNEEMGLRETGELRNKSP